VWGVERSENEGAEGTLMRINRASVAVNDFATRRAKGEAEEAKWLRAKDIPSTLCEEPDPKGRATKQRVASALIILITERGCTPSQTPPGIWSSFSQRPVGERRKKLIRGALSSRKHQQDLII